MLLALWSLWFKTPYKKEPPSIREWLTEYRQLRSKEEIERGTVVNIEWFGRKVYEKNLTQPAQSEETQLYRQAS